MRLLLIALLFLILPVNVRCEMDGKELYLYWCSQCHGLEGKGDGINAMPDMLVNPRNHTDAAFMSTRTDKQLEEVIKGGGASVSKSAIMPPWRTTLSEREIKSLVAYLRTLCKCQFEGVVSDEKLKTISHDFK